MTATKSTPEKLATVERLAEDDPDENAVYYFMRLDGWLIATGLQHNRDLLRSIAALEEANDRDEPAYAEASL